MVRHDEYSIKFLQVTDLFHVLQVTLANIIPSKLKKEKKKKEDKKKKREESVMIKFMKAFIPPVC